jgi:DNA-binding transcriptional ArsR family regulator
MESAQLDALAQGLQGFGHPTRIRALVLLEFESSPAEIATVIDAPLGVVSYHVRMLREYGLIEQTRTEPKRGALQHFYRRTELAEVLLGKLNGLLGAPARQRGHQGQGRRSALAEWALTV